MTVALMQSGSGLIGAGTITVNIPNYTGNDFDVSAGTFSNPTISFSGPLGRNPAPGGGSYIGTLSFSGTITSSTTMTGTLTYTPPRTLEQIFTSQTATGVVLTKH
jgi:hypothetical protein